MAQIHMGNVAVNRKARFNYDIEEELEAGLMLTGSEVKSLRAGKATISEAYCSVENEAVYLINAHISEFAQANRFNHAPTRPRKLLLHKRQIHKLMGAVQREGKTIIPLKLHFNSRGVAKLWIGVAGGKKKHDKRQAMKEKDWQRDKARLMRMKN